MPFDFTQNSMQEIIATLKISLQKHDTIEFVVLNPDFSQGLYAGEEIELDGKTYIHRSFKAYTNLSELLGCRMLTPLTNSKYTIKIKYQKLNHKSFHEHSPTTNTEKYGIDSIFARIHKLEEPTFMWTYLQALNAVNIENRKHILNLGINSGDEFVAIINTQTADIWQEMVFTGIDHSKSAIKKAKQTLPYPNVNLICHDINDIDNLQLAKQDLIISIGTLQSPAINTKLLVMNLVQNYLCSNGAIIFAFPNSRWIDGELVYGAKAPNYPYSEMSLLVKDIYWIKKYLQQHKFRVTITGKEYLFLTATKIKTKIV